MSCQPRVSLTTYSFIALCVLAIYGTGCKKVKENVTVSTTGIFANGSDIKPNIIFILSDDVGFEVPTYSGGESYNTPNLDFMAASGTQFSLGNASPLCSPSRFMLMTGKYNFRNYYRWGVMGFDQRTVANLAKDAGYATCVSGKWQFDGGDQAIHNFGFDSYAVNEAFDAGTGEETENDFYKDPVVYEDGNYLPASVTKGKYGPDVYRDYVFNFIDSNKNKPFFIYWAMNLCHKPFCPTPDDPDFGTWISGQDPKDGDTIYFPSMVRYMDKQIGQLMTKLQQMNLDKNTLIIFSGDNGTPEDIFSRWNGQTIQGGKSEIVERGYHVPLVAYMPGSVPGGRKDLSLIDFTDLMPTFADLLKTNVPSSFGQIDGVSFYPQLAGLNNKNSRNWVFCQYLPHPEDSTDKAPKRWIENKKYKEYDTINGFFKSSRLFDILDDPEETTVIPPSGRTLDVKILYENFRKIMEGLH